MSEAAERDEYLQASWYALHTDRAYEALRTLFDLLYEDLYRYALRIVQSRIDAEDAIQNTFADLWQYRKTLDRTAPVRPYLFRAVRNHSMQLLRTAVQTVDLTDTHGKMFYTREVLPDEVDEGQRRRIVAVLNGLPPRQRETLYLRFYEDLNYHQIATVMGINYQSVVNNAHKAVRRLRMSYPTRRTAESLKKKYRHRVSF